MTETDEYNENGMHPEELTVLFATVGGVAGGIILTVALLTWAIGPPSPVELLPAAASGIVFALLARPLSYRIHDWGQRLEERVQS